MRYRNLSPNLSTATTRFSPAIPDISAQISQSSRSEPLPSSPKTQVLEPEPTSSSRWLLLGIGALLGIAGLLVFLFWLPNRQRAVAPVPSATIPPHILSASIRVLITSGWRTPRNERTRSPSRCDHDSPDVEELRDHFGFPGMRILQFAWGGDTKNIDLPHNYIPNSCVYTGTHDNDTTVGWFNSKAGKGSGRDAKQIKKETDFCKKYLQSDGSEIHWDFIKAVIASVSNTAIIPMQDLLGLGNDARMNLPGSTKGNWYWRCEAKDFDKKIAERLADLVELYGRS
ncbi:MAG: hypothetical protein HC846_14170 [Blastocatellia bacterium]|nr:hypothetical protein [Blastocatellia bacterium]